MHQRVKNGSISLGLKIYAPWGPKLVNRFALDIYTEKKEATE